jgi:predicted nucleic acid-binding protein
VRVVDASVVLELVLGTEAGVMILDRYFNGREPLHAPGLMDVEVVQVLRRYVARGEVSDERGREAVDLLMQLPIRRHDHGPLLERAWALRGNLPAYDAVYVALAEGLRATFVTRDKRLAGTPGIAAPVEMI